MVSLSIHLNLYLRPTICTTGCPEMISKTVVPRIPIIAKRPLSISAARLSDKCDIRNTIIGKYSKYYLRSDLSVKYCEEELTEEEEEEEVS